MPNRIKTSITALKRTWNAWAFADATKALWELVPKKIRDRWEATVTGLVTGSLGTIWISIKEIWSQVWQDVLTVIGIIVFSVALVLFISWKVNRKNKPVSKSQFVELRGDNWTGKPHFWKEPLFESVEIPWKTSNIGVGIRPKTHITIVDMTITTVIKTEEGWEPARTKHGPIRVEHLSYVTSMDQQGKDISKLHKIAEVNSPYKKTVVGGLGISVLPNNVAGFNLIVTNDGDGFERHEGGLKIEINTAELGKLDLGVLPITVAERED